MSLPDFVRKHVTVAALLGTAVAGVTACGTGTGNSAGGTSSAVSRPSPRPTDPLAGLTGTQILARALNDLKTASSVHFSGSFADSGQLTEMDMTIVHPASCQGTIGLGSKGSIAFIQLGKDAWVKPDKLFWTTQGSTDPAVLSTFLGRYLKTSPDDNLVKDLGGVRW